MNNCNMEQPRVTSAMAANQKQFQRVDSSAFYAMLPTSYSSFYYNWVRFWLQWYDGYVDTIHSGSNGLLSTGIGATIVNRAADLVFGGNLMFANSRRPTLTAVKDDKVIGSALNFISNDWSFDADFKQHVKRAVRYAFAGGVALLKLNNEGGKLWVDDLRADRFFYETTGRGDLRRVMAVLSFYTDTLPSGAEKQRFALIEDRHYEPIDLFGNEIPVVEYKMYRTTAPVQYLTINENSVPWDEIPGGVRAAFKNSYDFELNKPQWLKGFKNLGCYLFLGSDGVSDVPDIRIGESLLSHVTTYLYEYDFYNTCFNTDLYLARGRVIVPKPLQGPNAGAQNAGLDNFLFTKIDTMTTDDQKPVPVQFDLRATEWREARNILLESIATGIGLSVSTLASYLNDGSNRTAREVSAEESATTLFVENARRRFEKPINDCLCDVLRFYGYVDDVEVRWSKAGMTNPTVMVEYLSKAKEAGLISPKKAHKAFNFDDDEELVEEDWKLVEQAEAEKKNSLFE